ncbi:MAG: hypothetical protein JW737_05035 [Acidobacteria bacterium]|nr:hypothetical protein [Acidobacteriota bacterium]
MTGQQFKIKAFAFLIMLLFVSSSFAGYILVLKSGRKIYSDKPFEEKENGVYVTLPNDMVVYIKKKDIDYEATKALVERIRKQKIERMQKEASVQKADEPEIVEKTESPPVVTVTESKNEIIKPKTEPPPSQPVKVENQNKTDTTSTKLGEITDSPKDITKKNIPTKTIPTKQESPEKTVKSNGSFRIKTGKSIFPDHGIPVESIDTATITLDELIDMARGVQWEYSGICPICKGTGNSPLSTTTNVIVCTYCNGTGKSGAWNDETLKIGDDCPWCVLGYDELGKGPCRHCLGTGRYLGLDRLNILEPSPLDEGINEVGK